MRRQEPSRRPVIPEKSMPEKRRDTERRDYEVSSHLDQEGRGRQKQQARDGDAARLASGEISRADLAKKNDFFGAFAVEKFKIKSIGGELGDA
jgi:hypothetical protein